MCIKFNKFLSPHKFYKQPFINVESVNMVHGTTRRWIEGKGIMKKKEPKNAEQQNVKMVLKGI